MARKWDYRYAVRGFTRFPGGSCGYQTEERGEVPYNPNRPESSINLKMKVWSTAVKLAEEMRRDIVIYVFGNRIFPQVRSRRSRIAFSD